MIWESKDYIKVISDYFWEIHEKRRKFLEDWHRWFAWYPVTIQKLAPRSSVKCWLQYVYRRRHYYNDTFNSYAIWEYKEKI